MREVTAEALVDNLDVFADVGIALDCFQNADTAFNEARYEDAYTCYRVTYREAVQPGGATCEPGAPSCSWEDSAK